MRISERYRKRAERTHQANRMYRQKLTRMKQIVNDRKQLTGEAKMKLLHHLVMHADEYDVDRSYDEIETLERELYRDIEMEAVDKLCDALAECEKNNNSDESEKVISELLELYIPEFVNKRQEDGSASSSSSSSTNNDKDEKKKKENKEEDEDPSLREVESIDHPISATPQREVTEEYLQEKRAAIEKMLNENKHLTQRQRSELLQLLCRYLDRFSLAGENMERTGTVTHEIITGTNRPFRERLRIYSPSVQEIIDNEVRRMLREGVIQHSRSPYASNLLLVRKPDPSSPGGMKNRVCAAFVQLNTQTVKDSYPLPNIQVMFDKVGRSQWFTTMDLLNGFWQVLIKPEHRHKTAFITARGLFEFVVMPFGLCNAPATFQRLMDTVIKPEYRGFIETYIDDVMTHSKTFEQHLIHIETLLSLLKEHKLVVKLTKCKFAQREVKFLGHILSHNQLKPNPESVAAILKWQRPVQNSSNRKKALRGFLGMVGWYRKFIDHFADKARPLFNLLRDNVEWEWDSACQKAFEELRDAIAKEPVLAVADPSKEYELETDASAYALGAVLGQRDDEDNLRPIAYASKLLGTAERNYSATDREALAIVWALEHFNTYCEGHKYTAITDHAALRYMLNNKDKTPRMHRMVAKLSPYEIKLAYRPGSQNHAADLLSRAAEYMESAADDNASQTEANVGHTSKEKKKKQVRFSTRKRTPKLTDEAFEVEKIVGRRKLQGGKPNEYEYEVKWKNYGEEKNTWERLETLRPNAMDAVLDFETERQAREIGDEVVEEGDENVCNECGEVTDGPVALMLHRFHHHKLLPPSPDHLEFTTVSKEVLIAMQKTDKTLSFIHTHLQQPINNHADKYQAKVLASHVFITDEDGVLYCISDAAMKSRVQMRTALRVCIPQALRQQVMHAIHTGPLSAHPGIVRMIDKMKQYVWWPGMYSDVVTYVTNCVTCQKVKLAPTHVAPQAVKLPTRPFQIIGIDAVGPLPTTKKGNQYVIDCVCHFIRFVEGWAVPSIDMVSISRAVIEKIVCRYGLFEVLVSDRGGVFVGTLAAHVFRALKIKRIQTTAYHPQANGMIERFHATLKITLVLWSHECSDEWDDLLPFAIFAYNTAFHTTLQEVPHYLAHGYDARLPIDEVLGPGAKEERTRDVHEYAAELVDSLQSVYKRITEILHEVNVSRNEDEATARVLKLKIGDKVWVYDPSTKENEYAKLKTRWTGPHTIMERKSDVVYVVEKDGKQDAVNVARMKRAHVENEKKSDDEDKQRQHQLTLIEKEVQSLKEIQQQLLTQQHRKEKQMNEMKQHAAHIAKTVAAADKQQDNDDGDVELTEQENDELSAMCMEMFTYVSDVRVWLP